MASLIRVQTNVVQDVLVRSIHATASQRAEGTGLDRLRSLGWHARAVERERFVAARAGMPWLAELLVAPGDAGAVPEQLADREPLERPAPHETPSWRVPGPGGHVRHYLAMRAVEDAVPVVDGDALRFKRAWMAGFFRHCCEEVLDGD